MKICLLNLIIDDNQELYYVNIITYLQKHKK